MAWGDVIATVGPGGGHYDAVLGPNDKIYAPRNRNSAGGHAYMRIDPDDSIHFIGSSTGDYKYAGIGRAGTQLVAVPNNGAETLVIDTATGSHRTVATSMPAYAWIRGVGVGGHVFGAPADSPNVYRFNPTGDTLDLFPVTSPTGLDKWNGFVDIGGGRLFSFARSTSTALCFDTSALVIDQVASPPGTALAGTVVTSHVVTDFDVSIDVTDRGGSPYNISVVARLVDVNNKYQVVVQANRSIRIYKRIAGTWTSLAASAAGVFPANTQTRLRFTGTGTALKCYVGSTLVASATDASIASGRCGMESGDSSLVEVSKFEIVGVFTDTFPTVGPTLGPNWTVIAAPNWQVRLSPQPVTPLAVDPTIPKAGQGVYDPARNKIYGIGTSGLAIVDAATLTLDTIINVGGRNGISGCWTPDGRVIFAPETGTTAVLFNPATYATTYLPTGGGYTKAVRRDDWVYFIPFSAVNVLKIGDTPNPFPPPPDPLPPIPDPIKEWHVGITPINSADTLF